MTLDLNGTIVKTRNINDLANAIEAFTYYYNVADEMYYVNGTAQNTVPTLTLTWAWAFEGNDVADTTLGNLMAEVPGVADAVGAGNYNLEITIEITATATQID